MGPTGAVNRFHRLTKPWLVKLCAPMSFRVYTMRAKAGRLVEAPLRAAQARSGLVTSQERARV
ncbi:hypothetical protein GCM10007857_63980 [Bradyrhizobium iriomotense]|uniref:Uncharacterized protein n=1 Tax=Bradyrhizobium iriomotense TaxID=441950 RepID=A0ABQ6B5M0_9BRAD|nr:hypothetical protein GCM10007857_63980 [Bradyrhizobium iriomotense]